ncbi:DUF1217 domain-containing protein [Antarctobacter sp.]|uniref:DUF1217 domain-containing protein n=1 Tax=Antarctobacter sp. TaxID=1872577 RepID=UPI002B2714F7|nr:DUF1217 domain-containing protein [Antarctobacter sp.]
MAITPMIPGTGLVGWQVLQSTLTTQRTAFNSSSEIARDTDYFAEKIGSITSGEELVKDRRLLGVALSAFGLSDQVDSTYLIKRVLEEGTDDDTALANKLSDGRYVALANAFDFSEKVDYPFLKEGFSDDITAAYDTKVRADLDSLLAQPEYVNDPDAAAALEEQTLLVLETTKAYFEENITSVTSVDDFLADTDLVKVALGAFGAEKWINSPALLKQALVDGGEGPGALANVLGEKGLAAMSRAFGFDTEPSTVLQAEDFASDIIDSHQWQLFEEAVSNVNPAIGNALSFQRAAPGLAGLSSSNNTKWYSVLGDTMMRDVFQTALGLPAGFSQIDLDKQLEMLTEKAESRFGITEFADLEDSEVLNKVIHSYLLQSQVSQSAGTGSSQIALTLLSSINIQRF